MKTKVVVCCLMVLMVTGMVFGEAEALTKVNFQLNWKITADHAAYYVALKNGWFEEEGLDVNIIIGQGSGYTVQVLDSGKAEIGISDAPVPIKGIAQGAEIKIVGIIFDKHPNCMYFWKDSGITKPQDIVGKTVAVPAADGHYVMWPAFAKQIGVDADSVKFVNIEPAAKVAALATKKADVVFELYTGKPFMEKAIPPEELGTILWSDHGFNAYAHSLVARNDVIESNPEMVKGFLKAAYRGWDFVLKNPEEAIQILSEYHPINQTDYLANLMLVMEFFKTDRYKNNGIGYIDPDRLKNTIELVEKYIGVEINFEPEDAYTSDFFPDPPYKFEF
jgi:NitT/TauT family transport system substrate-binding protein